MKVFVQYNAALLAAVRLPSGRILVRAVAGPGWPLKSRYLLARYGQEVEIGVPPRPSRVTPLHAADIPAEDVAELEAAADAVEAAGGVLCGAPNKIARAYLHLTSKWGIGGEDERERRAVALFRGALPRTTVWPEKN